MAGLERLLAALCARLDELCPIENAAMAERTCIEWDKDDIDALNILKVDVLGLGMLSCLRRAFALLRDHEGIDHSLASVPPDVVRNGLAGEPLPTAVVEQASMRRECQVFCVWLIGSMLPERSKDDDDFQRTAGRVAEGL